MRTQTDELSGATRAWQAYRLTSSFIQPALKAAALKDQTADAARRIASDRKVHAETQRAIISAVLAARRARRIGMSRAASDRRVSRHIRHATKHASRAATLVVHPPRRGRFKKVATVIVVSGGVIAGVAYAGVSRSGRSEDSSSGLAQSFDA